MNRRSFAAAAPGEPLEIRLGVASYSFREKPPAEAIRGMQALGVRHMKMKSEAHLPLESTPAQVAEARRMLDDAGIMLESTGNHAMDRE